ncbi:MAG: T9SS type A sorting domain-containing protein, partial [Thermoplasmata archaeon]
HQHTVDSEISGTDDDLLYQTELFWIDGYRFDQNNGYYTVILHFAELYYDYVGGRIFDAYIEDELVLDRFDIYAETGFRTATTRTFNNIYVADGRLDIDFIHHQAHAKLSAIEIISEDFGEPQLSVNPTDLNVGSTETTISFTITNSGGGTLQWQANENPDEPWITSVSPSNGNLIPNQSEIVTVEISREGMGAGDYKGNITVSSNGGDQDIVVNMAVIYGSSYIQRVDCGGDQNYTDYNGEIWEADQSYSPGAWGYIGGETYSTSDEISNTNDDILYQSERWGLTSYNFDVQNGVYEVKLMFAEIYFNTNGKRVFNVNIEGQQVLTEYDIYAEAGHDNATFHIFTTEVNDGQLNIDFISDIEDPKISAIQVISKSINPILSVTPTALDFGSSTTSMTFEVKNSGGETLDWEAAENPDEPWITSVSPGNGALAGEEYQIVTVTVDRNGMDEGEHLGTVTIISNGGEQDVTIRMTVPGAPLLSVLPDTLDCGTTTTSMTFTVSNAGGETLNWSAFENPDEQWIISLNPNSGSLEVAESQVITVTIDRNGMNEGEYFGNITVTSNGGEQNITIKMTVPGAPLLSVSPNTLDFGTTTTSMMFTVSNEGGETLNWNASENPEESWISSLNPTNGNLLANQSTTVTVNIDRADLEDGDYFGTITVTSNGGDQNIIVKMTVITQSIYVQRVNCGGSSYSDVSGNLWDADKPYTSGNWGYTAGSTYSTNDPIDDTEDDFLYQSERWEESLSYRFDVSNGSYNVTLHFAEIYYGRKKIRIFDISIENQKLINNYDIYADVGHDAATSKSFIVDVSDGILNIDLVADKNAAKISAIEVIASIQEPQLSVTPTTLDFGSSASIMTFEIKNTGGAILDWEAAENPDESWISSLNPTSGILLANQSTAVTVNVNRADLEDGEYFGTITVTSNGGDQNIVVKMTVSTQYTYVQRVNCGGSSYIDVSDNFWDADKAYTSGSWGYIAGNTYSTNDPIYNTPDDILYQTERWGLQGYQFDVANGQYEVTLRFAEIYLYAPGKRVFDVQIEGNTVLSNFDIYAEAGHDNALDKIFIINVNDNQLTINFIKGIEDPKISAIQVTTYQERHNLEKLVQHDTNPIIENIPGEFKLYNNYPNPFNPSTTISFDLPFEAQVKLSIFNMLGQQVAILMDGILAAGSHLYNWQAKNEFGQTLPSGIYLYRIEVKSNPVEENQSFFITKKMSLTK